MTITITHTHADGTLLDGTTRSDMPTIKPVLRSHAWRWSRNLDCWYQSGSRDRLANRRCIDATADHLRNLGYPVEVSVDNTPRDMATAEADRADRAEARADRLTAKARRLHAESDAYLDRADRLADRFSMGQPILVGHHSERRARRDADRIHDWTGKGMAAYRDAQATERAAESAAAHMGARYNPETVANRVRKLEAELRSAERRGANAEYCAHLANRLGYWREVRADQQASGEATAFGPADVAKGDMVRIRGCWYPVVRVNRVSVSVPSGYSWTNTVRYEHIQQVVKPGEGQAHETAQAAAGGSAHVVGHDEIHPA